LINASRVLKVQAEVKGNGTIPSLTRP
jgi:hypothetical protein